MVDTKLKKRPGFTLENTIPSVKSRDHLIYSNPTRTRQKRLAKRLPMAIAHSVIRTNYPSEVEELCQVLEAMIKRRLAEEIPIYESEELSLAA